MDTHIPLFDRDRLDEYGKGLPVIGLQEMPNADREAMLELYRAMVRFSDRHLGSLMGELKRRQLYDQALIVVCADHGESFGEHRQFAHSGEPFDEQVHVPLVIKFPAGRHAGKRHPGLVELVDLLPTVLDLAGVSLNEVAINGHSLLPILEGTASDREYAYSANNVSPSAWGVSSLRGRDWRYMRVTPPRHRPAVKVGGLRSLARWILDRTVLPAIRYRQRERYYDLSRDPTSARNLAGRRALAGTLALRRQALEALTRDNLERQATWSHPPEEALLDDRVKDRLAALGYLD
jgi:arylsulfatase A-like enzyme